LGQVTIRRATHGDTNALIALWRLLEDAQGPFRIFPLADGVRRVPDDADGS
jgi:hypothetical protein